MTLTEAREIAKILEECDSGCNNCVKTLVALAQAKFPEFNWVYTKNQENFYNLEVTENIGG